MNNIIRYVRQSLSMKLGLSILLLTVIIFVVSLGALFLQSRYLVKHMALQKASSVLNTTVQRVVSNLSTVETATDACDWLVADRLQPDSLLVLSRRIVTLNANVNGCSITTEPNMFPQYGRYFSAYTVRQTDTIVTVREGEYEYFDKVWYRTPRDSGKPCWVDPFDDFNEGTLSASAMIASYCKPLYDSQGRFIGVISSDLSLPRLSEIIATEKPYPNSYFMLLGEDGHYFVHPDTTRLVSKTIFSGTDPKQHSDIVALGHEMTSGKQGSIRIEVDGHHSLVCYQPVPGTKWSMALVCPDSDILSSYNRLSYIILPLLTVGLLLILLFCRHIVAHAIRPLSVLEQQIQRIALGQYDRLIPHSGRLDAVGRLQDSFATMQQSLNRHVSEILRINNETEQRNEELLQASSLAEEAGRQKSAFIQNMTHQIRTPLNIIMGFSQVLRDNLGELSPDEVKSITDMMNHNTGSLSRMVLMLYDSSDSGFTEELSSNQSEVVAVNEVARECIAVNNSLFPDLHVDFETALPDTFTILSNRLYLVRSLREVLYNSAKYSDGQHIALRVSKTGSIVRFVFQDTGPGISADYRPQMFEPFTKVNDLSEGLGLGLPLSKRHICNLGGDLILDTTYRLGCRFIVTLPANHA